MTKRFTVIDHNEWSEGDIIYYDDGKEMGWMDVCDKLNELHEEKEIAIEGIQIANDLIMKYGSEELKHEWQKNVRVKE